MDDEEKMVEELMDIINENSDEIYVKGTFEEMGVLSGNSGFVIEKKGVEYHIKVIE